MPKQNKSKIDQQLNIFHYMDTTFSSQKEYIKYKKRKGNDTMISTSLAVTEPLKDKIKKEAEENGTSFVAMIETMINSVPLNNLSFSKKEKKIKLGLSLPKMTFEKLRRCSNENNCTMNEVLEKIIKYYFKNQKK